MIEYKLQGKAIENYNDTKKGTLVEKDETVIEDRARYEELFAKGLVTEGTIVEEKRPIRKLDDLKLED
jgi:hypothetical protein